MLDKIATLLGEQPEDINYSFESIHRVSSSYAVQKQLPRDVMVQLISKKMKEDILSKSYKEPLEIDGKSTKILKELPRKVINSRRDYRLLAQKLKKS